MAWYWTRASALEGALRDAPPLGGAPDFTDYSLEVCSQYFLDYRRGLAAFGEFGGDDFHVIGAVEVGHVGIAILSRGADAEFLAACDVLIEGGFLFGGQDRLLDRAIGSDAHVIGTAYVDGVHDVVKHMFARGHGGRSYDIGHEIDAKIAAAIG